MSDAEWMRRGKPARSIAPCSRSAASRAGTRSIASRTTGSPQGPVERDDVIELFALDPEAEQRLWQWVCSATWMRKIVGPARPGAASDAALGARAAPPRDDRQRRHVAALPRPAGRARGPNATRRTGRLVLDIADDMFDSNAGRWQLTVAADGRTTCATTAEPDLELDIATLACDYLGTYRFAHLARAGRRPRCRRARSRRRTCCSRRPERPTPTRCSDRTDRYGSGDRRSQAI